LVRERLTAGDSDAQVLAYLQARYGDYVLLNPPVDPRPGCCGSARPQCW
jgi:cytochrome c-type biogenesis protein CcmH